MEKNNTKIKSLHLAVFLLICIAAFFVLSAPVRMMFHQTDFWWMIPTLSNISQHNSFWETIRMLFFSPAPTNNGEPSMNLYLFLIYHFLGFKMQYFIFISIILHLCCAFFFYRILQRIGLSIQIAFISTLIYAFSFFHSLYFLWPMSAHHLTAMFFILLTINLFLEMNYRLDHGLPWKVIFWQALFVNFLASFCQISILVLPMAIFIYILCCSGSHLERSRRYDIWIPLFIAYLGHPLIRMVFWGYPASYQGGYLRIFKKIASRIPFLGGVTFNTGLGISPVILYLLFFIAGLACLFFIRRLFRITFKPAFFTFLRRAMLTCLISYLVLFSFSWKLRSIVVPIGIGIPLPDFISPYNFIRPLVGILGAFLNPVRTALSMNAAAPYYYIPMRSDILWAALFMFLVAIFLKNGYLKCRGLIFFVIIYLFGLPLLTQISLWERKNSIPSRYLVYTAPLFAVIFSCAVSSIYNFFMNKIRISAFKRELILVVLFLGVCLLNVSTIKFILEKDKFVNEFLIYDYIKGADLIKQDLGVSADGTRVGDICVKGVLPMPFREYEWNFSPANPLDLDTFKYTLAQVLNDRDALNICMDNAIDADIQKRVYIFDKTTGVEREGKTIDPFLRGFYEAKKEFGERDYRQARVLFEQAVQARPFFFRLVLSNRPLEYMLPMANGRSARALISDISNLYRSWVSFRVDKVEYIADMLDTEMKDCMECFFYLSYLSYLEKDIPASRYWYSRIRFIDNRNTEAIAFLSQQPMIKADPEIQKYINEIKNDPSYRKEEGA